MCISVSMLRWWISFTIFLFCVRKISNIRIITHKNVIHYSFFFFVGHKFLFVFFKYFDLLIVMHKKNPSKWFQFACHLVFWIKLVYRIKLLNAPFECNFVFLFFFLLCILYLLFSSSLFHSPKIFYQKGLETVCKRIFNCFQRIFSIASYINFVDTLNGCN